MLEGRKGVEYTIVTKWWWKKLLEEIKCKLISSHPKTTVFGLVPSALSSQRNTHKSKRLS
jgi:hypothetical protein